MGMEDEFGEVIAEFLVESYENLDRLDQDLLALEERPDDPSTLASAFRTVHTIKGTCGFLGYSRLEAVTHVGENLLSRLRDGELRLDAEIATALLETVDAIRVMLAAIEETSADGENDYPDLVARLSSLYEGGPRVAPVVTPAVGDLLVAAGAVVPGDVSLALSEQDLGDERPIGEILVDHGAVDVEEVDRAVSAQRSSLAESSIRVDVGVLDRLMTLVGELVLSRNNILQHVDAESVPAMVAASQQLDLVTGELQECVMKTRMQPIGTVWSRFGRVVRDLAVQCGKQVRIEMDGEETELDKTILEAIKDPLTHVVRNTVDHGIEDPDARLAAGKPAEGTLRLRAHHEGGQVIIEIADDGAGIDPAKVIAKAVSKGLLTEARAAAVTTREAISLIFTPGFSTAAAVTNVSGRGVGMDVVKTNIERIGGTVDVESEVGRGTVLRIKIPLTLAIVPALMVSCAGQRFALPQIEVLELVRLEAGTEASSVEMLHNAPVYRLRGDLLPLVHLREQLDVEPMPDDQPMTIAVVATDDRPWGLVIDGVATTEEIVVKPLGPLLRAIPAFSGATIMGDGRIALILDTARIGREAGIVARADAVRAERGASADGSGERIAKVLIVTDGEEQIGIDLAAVDRLEQFRGDQIEGAGTIEVIQYRDAIMPLARLGRPDAARPLTTIVFEHDGGLAGLVVERIVDIVETTAVGASVAPGAIVARERVTRMLDIAEALDPAFAWLDRNKQEHHLTEVGS